MPQLTFLPLTYLTAIGSCLQEKSHLGTDALLEAVPGTVDQRLVAVDSVSGSPPKDSRGRVEIETSGRRFIPCGTRARCLIGR